MLIPASQISQIYHFLTNSAKILSTTFIKYWLKKAFHLYDIGKKSELLNDCS